MFDFRAQALGFAHYFHASVEEFGLVALPLIVWAALPREALAALVAGSVRRPAEELIAGVTLLETRLADRAVAIRFTTADGEVEVREGGRLFVLQTKWSAA